MSRESNLLRTNSPQGFDTGPRTTAAVSPFAIGGARVEHCHNVWVLNVYLYGKGQGGLQMWVEVTKGFWGSAERFIPRTVESNKA